MDLRYLSFLLSAHSWTLLGFMSVVLLWVVLGKITELGVGPIKVKTADLVKSSGLLILAIVLFTFAMRLIDQEMAEEMAARTRVWPRVEPVAWAAPWEELTHGGWAHAAFAHLRFSDEPIGGEMTAYTTTRRVPDYSIVQNCLWWATLGLPILLVALETYVDTDRAGLPESTRWNSVIGITVVFGAMWLLGVYEGTQRIQKA